MSPSSQGQSLEIQPSAEKLMRLFHLNVTVFLGLGLVYLLLKLTHWFYDVFAILGGSLLLTYLLLGPVNTVDKVFQKLAQQWTPKWPTWIQQNLIQPLSHHLSLRVFAVLLVYLAFGLVIGFGSTKMVPFLSREVSEFTQDLPVYLKELDHQLGQYTQTPEGKLLLEKIHRKTEDETAASPNLVHTADANADPSPLKPSEVISKNAIGQVVMYIQKSGPKALHEVLEVATTTLEGLIYLIATLVIIFYLLLDGEKLKKAWVSFLPTSFAQSVDTFLDNTHQMLFHFLKGQIVLSVLGGGYMWLVYCLFGLKYAGFLGAFFAICSILPMVGPWIGIAPALLVVLFSSHQNDLMAILMLSACYYLLKEFWLNRLITGNRVAIHPVLFLLSFLTCIKMTGPVGILLSFPLASLLYALIRYIQGKAALIEEAYS